MVAQSQAFRCRSLVKVVSQTCSCYRGSCRNDMLSFLPTRFETHWAHFRCSIWTYSSGRGQKFMLKQSLGPRDHTGMLSDQLRSDLSSSALLHRRAQIHRKLQFALCYSDASCIVVCVKVAPQHLIVGWQVPPFHTVTLLSHFKDLQIFIGTIIYHVFLKQI